ncbi:MAG: hypothetical protein HY305_00320 [Sphingobacteriales bacterium]|nr:hypothetical protein [Sphingobacteriales bacterium]
MKNIFTTLILFCLFTYNGFTQTTIQATIFDAGANTVQLYGNPNVNVADSLFNQIKICLSIADMGVLNPSWSDIIVNSQIPSLDVYVDNSNPYINENV